jgi:hypothetical protein
MAVAVGSKEGLEIGASTALFPTRMNVGPSPFYDVSADGTRFLVSERIIEEDREPLTLVVGWPALVKKAGPP